jgi:hypothetical protein
MAGRRLQGETFPPFVVVRAEGKWAVREDDEEEAERSKEREEEVKVPMRGVDWDAGVVAGGAQELCRGRLTEDEC